MGVLKATSVLEVIERQAAPTTAFTEVEIQTGTDIAEGIYPRVIAVALDEDQPIHASAAITSAQDNILGTVNYQIGGSTQANISLMSEDEDVFFACGWQSQINMPAAAAIAQTLVPFGHGSFAPFWKVFNPGVIIGGRSFFLRDDLIDADTQFTAFPYRVRIIYDRVTLTRETAQALGTTGRLL